MSLNFRFAVISDLHIALPQTIWNHPSRFHLVEVSIPVLENILDRLSECELDFLLLPGDLTQHGEPANHTWLAERLAQLPYPTYVIPGNHDVPSLQANHTSIGLADFPHYYRSFGYDNPKQLYYTCQLLPGVRLIALNSNQFNAQDKQLGCLDDEQLVWLQQVLETHQNDLILVMIHHNVVEHLPGQARHPIGQRYMLDNAPTLLQLLRNAGVQLVFTGHLHVQDVAYSKGVYDITTGSLVSYPHPYRVLELQTDDRGQRSLQITSGRVESVPGWETLQQTSRDFMGDRSQPFMLQLLMQPALKLSQAEAEALAPSLRYFWADLANGDATFTFPEFPNAARRHFERFSAIDAEGQPQSIDNAVTLRLS
ncbi:metallophosphoesterase family protein [Stenomitos frigidus]|uniref:Metallophosphoesterase n=1 Tax=Stenomitos frigidus ULC18 TaxID=2107698 RepID=A0A2T1ECM2_9CYAN|nr:metallophosphoesterase [Stenomitos frigidus]PSB30445.1 metallophosphoesterase [Stenomitos frigidus ULC18]